MSLPTPREYQQRLLDLARRAYSDGHRRIMLFLATGGGKSVIFILTIAQMLMSKKRVILVMRRKQLVKQAQRQFTKWGIDCSIVMGTEKGFDPNKSLQICSIDTISRRDLKFLDEFDVCVVDECHDCTSPKYKEFLSNIKTKLFIGLTASPFAIGNKVHDFWSCCVKPIEMHDLRKLGFLVPSRVLVPSDLNLDTIKTVAGDYHQGQLADTMSEMKIIGDVLETYKKEAMGKPAILFAVNKEHSRTMAEMFNNEGIPAVHCDEGTKQKERDKSIAMLKSGEIKILCNVNIFSTGVDIPEAEVGLMCRPTKSEVLYIQQIGRLLRPYRKCGKCSTAYDNSPQCPLCGYDKPSYIKKEALIIDHGNNISRFGSPYKVRKAVLTKEDAKKKKEENELEIKTKVCKGCFAAYLSHLTGCPYCGYTNEKVERTIKRADGKLVPYDEFQNIMSRLLHYQCVQLDRGLKPNFPYFKIFEEFGDTVMLYPELKVPKWLPRIIKKNIEKEEKGLIYR